MSRPATTTPGLRGEGDAVPPGWRTNPSAWRQRLPIIGLALVGFAVAGYLTLFQVGAIDSVWEPFFGVAVGPLGAVSVLLVIAQPVLYDAFCTLCLVSAVVSLAMIAPAMDEVLASLQVLARVRRAGGSVWRAFRGLEPTGDPAIEAGGS